MKKIYFFLMATLLVVFTNAQTTNYGTGTISLTSSGVAVVQDFNSLPTTGSANPATSLPSGWYASETGSGGNTTFSAGTGSSSTGDIWSFGVAGTNPLGERAYGQIRSGSLIPIVGAQITNNLGSSMGSIAISYRGEQWRCAVVNRNTLLDTMYFEYSTDATSLNTGTWTRVAALRFVGFTYTTTGAKDGNATGNFTAVAEQTINFSTAIPSAGTVWIRWVDFDASGSDDGLAIDDVSIKGVVADPTITVNPLTLSTFTQTVGIPSTTQNYTLSGTNLTTGIVATPPVNYEISNDGGTTWFTNSSPLTLVSNGSGGITGQPVTIQVRLNAASGGTYAGNISHTATGATTANVAVTGNTVTNFYNNNSGTLDLVTSWGSNTDGTGANPTSMSQNLSLFVAKNNSTASFGAVTSITGTGSKLIIGDGINPMTVTIPNGNSLTSEVDVLSQGTLICQDLVLPTLGTIATNSTVSFDGATILVPVKNYHNLILVNGANLPAAATVGIAGTFNPGTTVTATANSTINFNGTALQTIPAFSYDSAVITNAVGATTPNTTATINFNRGLRVSNPLTITATDIVNTKGSSASFTIDATKSITVNGRLVLQSLIAPNTAANTLIVNSGGKYIVDANVSNSGGFIPAASTNAVYNAGSEVLILQGAPRIVGTTGGDVTWNSIGAGTLLNNAAVTISGTLTVNAGAINLGSGGTGRVLTVANLIVSGGEFDVLGAPGSGATNQTLNVTGNVTVSGGNLYASIGTAGTGTGFINIGGNVIHTSGNLGGAQTVGASTYNFNGSVAQTIVTNGLVGNVNTTINNSNGVTLTSGDMNLGTGTLTLTSGKFTIGANNVTASVLSGGSATAYVVTNSTGTLNLNIPASTGTYNLPIGTTANYRPASINFTAAPIAGILSAKTIVGTPSTSGLPLTESGIMAPDDNITTAADDYWEVNSTATGGTYNITLIGNGQVGVTDFSKTTVLKKADLASNWTLEGTHVTTTGTNAAPIMSRTGLTSFSVFAIGGGANGILPLNLISFSAAVNNGIVNLNWVSSNESNLLAYDIEKSVDGISYNTIGSVAARNNFTQSNYTFSDVQNSGISYYRLKIKEINGSFKNSKVLIVNANKKVKMALYPNPVTTDIYLSYKKASNNASFQIRSIDGILLLNKPVIANSTNTTLDVSKLKTGTYVLVYFNGVELEKEFFVKQ
jgi:hypothetical protein